LPASRIGTPTSVGLRAPSRQVVVKHYPAQESRPYCGALRGLASSRTSSSCCTSFKRALAARCVVRDRLHAPATVRQGDMGRPSVLFGDQRWPGVGTLAASPSTAERSPNTAQNSVVAED
jgi:hypothetical protein